jgi:ribosomal protein S18 acetylase RimI-like enzyme
VAWRISGANTRDAEQIVRWLKKEAAAGEGFHHDRDILRRAAREQEMLCARLEDRVVGFGVFTFGLALSAIDIVEIRPRYRRLGVGTRLATEIIALLFSRSHRPIRIQCAPASSEPFWRRFGFFDDPGAPSGFGGP